MNEAKPFVIDKRLVWEAYHKVKENKGSAGIDEVDQKTFDKEMSKNLLRISQLDREYRCFLTVCNIMHIRLVHI